MAGICRLGASDFLSVFRALQAGLIVPGSWRRFRTPIDRLRAGSSLAAELGSTTVSRPTPQILARGRDAKPETLPELWAIEAL